MSQAEPHDLHGPERQDEAPQTPPAAVRAASEALRAHLERVERQSWGLARWPAHPADDRARRLLRALALGQSFEVMDELRRLSWPVAEPVARGLARGLGLPGAAVEYVVYELRDAWPYLMVAGDGGRPAAWRDWVLRALETTGGAGGPIAPVAGLLSDAAWRDFAWEMAGSPWRPYLRLAWPAPRGRASVACYLAGCWRADPDALERSLDVLMCLRAAERWERDPDAMDPAATHRRAHALRARLRARLRAAAFSEAPRAAQLLLLHDAPYARLASATRRLAYAAFWCMARAHFDGGLDALVPAPPGPAPEAVQACEPGPGADGALTAWVLLAVLRDHEASLASWRDRGGLSMGGNLDRLFELLTGPLRTPAVPGCIEHARLGVALERRRDLLLPDAAPGDPLQPYLEAVAAMDPKDRKGMARVQRLLMEIGWPPDDELPQSGFPTFVRNARRKRRPPTDRSDP